MDAFYRFLATYEGLIYILLILAGLFSFRWVWNSWCEYRESVFGLEREFATRRLSQSVALSFLLVLLFVGELFLASFVIPSLPASGALPTPTLDLLNLTTGATVGAAIDPTAVVGSPDESASELPAGCLPGKIVITSPEPGQEIRSTINIIGTVDVENFGFYKYEVSPAGAGAWATISAGRETVRNGELGLWDTTALTPGDYELSLTVVDNQGQLIPPCVIPVRVVSP